MKRRLQQIREEAIQQLAHALFVEAHDIFNKSQAQVPVLNSYLKNSGHVTDPVIRATSAKVTIGYGGVARAYAVVQHERTDFLHPRGGKAKYLEDPLMASVRGMEQRLGRRVRLGARGFQA